MSHRRCCCGCTEYRELTPCPIGDEGTYCDPDSYPGANERRYVCTRATCDGGPMSVGQVIKYAGWCWLVTAVTTQTPPADKILGGENFACEDDCDDCCGEPAVYVCAIACCLQAGEPGVIYVLDEGACVVNRWATSQVVRVAGSGMCYTMFNRPGDPRFIVCTPGVDPDPYWCLPAGATIINPGSLTCEDDCDDADCETCDDGWSDCCPNCAIDLSDSTHVSFGVLASFHVLAESFCNETDCANGTNRVSSHYDGSGIATLVDPDPVDCISGATGAIDGELCLSNCAGGHNCVDSDITVNISAVLQGGFNNSGCAAYSGGASDGEIRAGMANPGGPCLWIDATSALATLSAAIDLKSLNQFGATAFLDTMGYPGAPGDSTSGSITVLRGGPCQAVIAVAALLTRDTPCDQLGNGAVVRSTAKLFLAGWTPRVADCPGAAPMGPSTFAEVLQ